MATTNQQFSLPPSNTQSLNYLVYFILAVGVVASISLAIFDIKTQSGELIHWMVPLGISIMVVFMPLTAVSFLHFRLPKKQKEYSNILHTLESTDHGTEVNSYIIDTEHKSSDYLLPVLFVSLFTSLGFYILLGGNAQVLFKAMVWVDEADTQSNLAFRSSLLGCGFAFLGAYVWSVQYIFRRMVTLDLPPGAYYSVSTRLIFSSFLILIYTHFTYGGETRDQLSAALPVIAFLTGIFPERLLNWLIEASGNIFSKNSKMAHDLSLDMIEGVDSFHKARLSELGIDNVQNLAHASLVELIIKTPFAPRVIVDWMAQAKLCLEFKDDINNIRKAGVRTILDFQDLAEDSLLGSLAQRSGLDPALLDAIYCSNKEEKSIIRLRDAYDRLSLI